MKSIETKIVGKHGRIDGRTQKKQTQETLPITLVWYKIDEITRENISKSNGRWDKKKTKEHARKKRTWIQKKNERAGLNFHVKRSN